MDNSKIRTSLVSALSTILLLGTLSLDAASSHPVRGRHGVVSSGSVIASKVGVETLKQGGNAVDAAIATAFAGAVTMPSAGNIGGGGFLVYHGADGEATAFDFREKAPLASTSTMYLIISAAVRPFSLIASPSPAWSSLISASGLCRGQTSCSPPSISRVTAYRSLGPCMIHSKA